MVGFSDILLKNSDINVSIMSSLRHEIYMRLVIEEDLSMSEIQGAFPKYSDRTIIREVTKLLKSGKIEHKRIIRKGKRLRYCVNEENTKQDLTIKAFDEKNYNKRIIQEVHPAITQKVLSSFISSDIKEYHRRLKKLKDKPDSEYYSWHIVSISGCLEWINRLTFAITSGMLGDSPNKLALAQRNKEREEEFLQKLVFNIKARDEKFGERVLRGIYDELVSLWFMEKALT